MLRPARLCIAAVEPERHQGPLAPRGFERSKPRYSGADRAHLHHRPGLDETVFKRDCLLTNQPCEFTVTAVGEVKVLVLHGARKLLADRCACAKNRVFKGYFREKLGSCPRLERDVA